jgi:hypothetical protein
VRESESRGGGGIAVDFLPPFCARLQRQFPLTDVDRGLAGDDLGRQRRELRDIERGEVLLLGRSFEKEGEKKES